MWLYNTTRLPFGTCYKRYLLINNMANILNDANDVSGNYSEVPKPFVVGAYVRLLITQ